MKIKIERFTFKNKEEIDKAIQLLINLNLKLKMLIQKFLKEIH